MKKPRGRSRMAPCDLSASGRRGFPAVREGIVPLVRLVFARSLQDATRLLLRLTAVREFLPVGGYKFPAGVAELVELVLQAPAFEHFIQILPALGHGVLLPLHP